MVEQLATSHFWVPGWRQAPVFAVVALAGATSYAASYAALPTWLLAPGRAFELAHSPLIEFFGVPASMIVTAIAGLVFKRAFWLWGVAVALPAPAVAMILSTRLVAQGLIPPSHLMAHGVVAVSVFVNLLVLCTLSSALGTGLRMAVERLISGRARGSAG